MKQGLSKLKSINTGVKIVLIVICLITAIAVPMQMSVKSVSATTVEEIQAAIDALEAEIAISRAEAAKLDRTVSTLQAALAVINNEKTIIQAQIDIYQAQYDQLVIQISDTEKKIQNNKDALGVTLADMYVEEQITPIEMLASSKNIGDFLDKSAYSASIRDQLASTIEEIKALKKSLETKKAKVSKVLNDQKNAKKVLVEKENEQQNLIAETQGQEAAYQQLAAAGESRKKDLMQQQQDIIWAAQHSGGSVTGIPDATKGNYPWGGSGCYVAYNYLGELVSYNGINGDGSDALGYACRQCTSYSAWKVLEYTGNEYRNLGNAGNWPDNVPQSMVHTTPRAHSVGVIGGGQYGHVVWVETDPDASGYIIISQYNDKDNNTGDNSGVGWGNYSKIRVHQSTYNYFIYF